MDPGERPGLASVPAGHRLEVERLAVCVRGQPKRPAANQRVRLGEPYVLTRGSDDLLVYQPERPEPGQREEVARPLREQDLERVVVDPGEPAQLRGLARGDVAVAGDDLEEPGEIALARDRAAPAVDDVVGGYHIAVGEVSVVAKMKGVGEAVAGDGRLSRRDVRDLMQPRVESIETREDVTQDVDVGRARDQRRIEIRDVLRDRKAERLI